MDQAKAVIGVLWPSFVVAGVAEMVFFTLFDPVELHLLGDPVVVGSLAAYTIGFFVFWAFCAASSALTCFLQRSAAEVNARCPLGAASARPSGCPRPPASPGRD